MHSNLWSTSVFPALHPTLHSTRSSYFPRPIPTVPAHFSTLARDRRCRSSRKYTNTNTKNTTTNNKSQTMNTAAAIAPIKSIHTRNTIQFLLLQFLPDYQPSRVCLSAFYLQLIPTHILNRECHALVPARSSCTYDPESVLSTSFVNWKFETLNTPKKKQGLAIWPFQQLLREYSGAPSQQSLSYLFYLFNFFYDYDTYDT